MQYKDKVLEIEFQLYSEFDDKFETMCGELYDICSYIDVEDVKKWEQKRRNELMATTIRDLQQRIDKSVEWIINHIDTFEKENVTIYDWDSLSNPVQLLEILKGDEKSE